MSLQTKVTARGFLSTGYGLAASARVKLV